MIQLTTIGYEGAMSGMTQSKWRWCWQFSVRLLVMGGTITLRSPSLGIARSDSSREYLGSCRKRCNPLFCLGGGISIFCLVTSSPVQAQIVSDGTVGTIVNNPSGNIFEITGGTPAGSNLFHSFEQFSVPNDDVVRFINNNLNIQNVISRVTGQGPAYISNINGVIAAGGTAPNFNLFLLNPNGILFGPNAQLNIGGSFVATTANAIQFGNQGTFIASTSQNDVSLLTVNPSALFFNQLAAQKAITNQSVANPLNPSVVPGVGLRVPDGKNLLLIGGNVTLDGGVLRTPGGRVELGGVAGEGTIGLSVDGNNLRLESFPDSVARANVSLINGAEVNVRAGGSGSIAINAQNFYLTKESTLRAGIGEGLGLVSTQGRDIEINATGTISLEDASFISNSVRAGGIGKGGNIIITTGSLLATNGAQIYASSNGQGDAGSVIINARNTVSFDGQGIFNGGVLRASGAISELESTGVGKGGNIDITTGSLSVSNGAVLTTSTSGNGDAGNVTIHADTASFDGVSPKGFSSGAYSRVEQVTPQTVGNGGSIKISAGSLFVTNGAILTTSTAGKGDAGSVTINADTIFFDGIGSIPNPNADNEKQSSGAYSAVRPSGVGNAGNINITAREFRVTNGAVAITSTLGQGDAGRVIINANTVSFDGQGPDLYRSGAYSRVEPKGVGNGGGIEIVADSLSVTNGAQLTANTLGQGSAGNIQVDADSVTLSGVGVNGVSSGIITSSENGAIGNGGEITINTATLRVQNGAVVNARTLNASDGGSVIINANTIKATNGGQVITTTRSDGRAGNITINAADSIILSGSDATFADRSAQFGQNVVNEDSTSGLLANTRGSGNAGELKIFTGRLIVQDGAQVSAYTRGTGQAGTLAVNASDSVQVIGTSADGQNRSQLFFDSSGAGDAGKLIITTRNLIVQDGGQVSATTSAVTSDAGQGGIIAVKAYESVLVSGTNGQFASRLYFDSLGAGNARGISIETGWLDVQNGGQVTVSGSGSGSAGDLQITADSIFLNNQGKLQATNTSGAGSIRINTGELTVQNGSQVTVSGTGSGVSGNLEVKADSIFMNNQSNLKATTESGEGGNIRLKVGDTVWLRHSSNILTEAGGIGNGGNITINAGGFVLAILPENSDVAATAIQGRGGNIFVTAQGVFGFSLPERLVRTPDSDISAASELGINGTREIDTGNQPQPEALPDAPLPELIEPRCQVGRRQANSEFIISGRGGLPPNPSQTLSSNTGWVDFRSSTSGTENTSSSALPMKPTGSAPTQLVEAQGWIVNAKGEVELTASAPSATLYSSWQMPKACPAQNENVEK
ncbi:MAG TPA: filamentous hemagglutinin N-terminal domain-containing protein [Stenomitos sp.]